MGKAHVEYAKRTGRIIAKDVDSGALRTAVTKDLSGLRNAIRASRGRWTCVKSTSKAIK